jgi:hypothetical protein
MQLTFWRRICESKIDSSLIILPPCHKRTKVRDALGVPRAAFLYRGRASKLPVNPTRDTRFFFATSEAGLSGELKHLLGLAKS